MTCKQNTDDVPVWLEKTVLARVVGEAGCANGSLEPNPAWMERSKMLVAKMDINPTRKLVPLRMVNLSDRAVTVHGRSCAAGCSQAEGIESLDQTSGGHMCHIKMTESSRSDHMDSWWKG